MKTKRPATTIPATIRTNAAGDPETIKTTYALTNTAEA